MLRMRTRWLGVGLGLLACAAVVQAQSATDAFNAFRDSVVQKQLVLRNFSGESNVKAAWMGTAIQLKDPRWRMFAVVQVNSVKMHGQQVKLECQRRVAGWSETKSLGAYPVVDPFQITVDLGGGDPMQVLPQLRDVLFYASLQDALRAVPKPMSEIVPGHVKLKYPAAAKIQPCDCSEASPCARVMGAPGFTFPKAVRTEVQVYSDEARQRRINGDVVTAFMVDDTGHPHDVWITQPLGYGLDQAAANAVFAYVFQPAACHGSPVSVPLAAEINFQIF